MKHVFVETNFLVELLRPISSPDAKALFSRRGTDVTLYVPWASLPEAKRTLPRIIKEDLDFAGQLKNFRLKQLRAGRMTTADQRPFETFEALLKKEQYEALNAVEKQVEAAVARMTIIEPSYSALAKTMALFPAKQLPPLDEMILGAVLAYAAVLKSSRADTRYFCNTNKSDFVPTRGNLLEAEYRAVDVTFRSDFCVP